MEHEATEILTGAMVYSSVLFVVFILLMLVKSIDRFRCRKESYGSVIIWILWGIFSVKLFLDGCAVLSRKEKSQSLDEQYEAAVKTENIDAKVIAP